MERFNKSLTKGRPISTVDAAKANDAFDHFINAGTLKSVFGCYRNICELLHLKPNVFPQFYPKLKDNLTSWKAKALWKKFDARASHKCYARGKICPNTRVLIIGAGPCGLRTAIEAQLLGAKVVVVEKRDRMSRNNVLHLWPFVIEDLRALGAKKFFGKFCAGAIDHISIRQLQCILLKVALLLGVEVHTEVSFEKLVEPNSSEKIGWRAEFKPVEHPVSQYEFDVIVGADGKRNTLQGFKRKEFRGKLAIAITANFINKRTEAEARVEEISGVAFIFNQKFFKELNAETGIDLENIVYYKDDTHYFVMTAKKLSLIEKGVILQDYPDTARLLSPENVDRDNLMEYAREAAEFSTNYQMPDLEFAVNHYGQPDVAMFDFTSMYAAENASKVIERHGYKLFMILVGDSLLEPFWPTGSGCARGFLSSLDACWAIKGWGSGLSTPLEVLAERESIYRLLAQTTPENLNKDCKAYTVDPSTRYPNLNKSALLPQQVLTLYDTDDPNTIELTSRAAQPFINELHRKRRKRDLHLDANTLIGWIKEQIKDYDDLLVEDLTNSFRDGRVLCAILHHYRPDLLDYGAIKSEDVAKNNQLAFDLLEKEIGISPIMTGEEMAKLETPDYLTMFSYLTQIYDTFRGEIPHIKHPKLISLLPSCSSTPSLPFSPNAAVFSEKRHCKSSKIKIAKNLRKQRAKLCSKKRLKLTNPSHSTCKQQTENLNCVTCYDENFQEICTIKNSRNNKKGAKKKKKVAKNIVLRHLEESPRMTTLQELTLRVSSNNLHISVQPPVINRKRCSGELIENKTVCDTELCHFLKGYSTLKFLYAGKMNDSVSPMLDTEHKVIDWINATTFENRVKIPHNEVQETKTVLDETEIQSEIESPLIESMMHSISDVNISNIVQGNCAPHQVITEIWEKVSTMLETDKIDLSEVKENIREKTIPTITARINDGFASRFNIGRSKRHAEMSSSKPATTERKNKKRRSFEKYDMSVEERRKRLEEIAANRLDRQNKRRQQRKMQTEQFIKSMQMLQMNAKPDQSQPFEDYSLFVYRQTAPDFQDRVKNLEKQFTYIPDRENRLPTQSKTGAGDEEFAARIKDIEEKWRYLQPTEKKPKDLTRAIGKIETSDWNIKEIEKKILENKLGKSVNREKERVPKWNREQFLARQKKCINRQNSGEAKFSELDKGIKHLEQRLKEGSLRDLGTNKVAKITEKLLPKDDNQEAKPIKKNIPKPPVVLPTNSGSEYCHFCQKRVYLMERLSAEGRFFHRGCFKCQYCYTTLRLGSYLFDKEGQYGYRFYCLQHFGMVDETEVDRVDVKQLGKIRKEQVKPLEKLKIPLTGVEGVDLLNRVQTPERIEFSNLSAGHISSDHDESLSQMDEDEWTDRNFGASTAEICSSDEYEDSSSASGSESDNEEVFEEALEEPPTKEGTLRWMERYKQRYSKERRDSDSEDYISSSDHSSYDENTSGDEEDEPATEGEEEIRARELRKQEVRVEPPVIQTDTGSDTEIVSDDTSPESSSKHNSATEISTDSEFAVDDPTPTREIPAIVFNDQHVTMRKASFGLPKKVQVKSGILNSPNNGKIQSTGIRLEFTPLVPSPIIPKAAPSLLGRTEGYALNRTQSTGGIATKVSLELKKKYLLGDSEVPGSIQKSGSVSTLDSKFKSFHTNITDCQKLLKPSSENVQATPALKSPLSPIISQSISNNESPQIPAHNFDKTSEKQDQDKFQNEMENRPRSPAEEIPVIVPQIDWKRTNSEKVSDMSSDSLTSSDSDLNQHSGIKKSPTVKIIPRVEIHDDDGKIIANETVTKPEGVIPEPTQDLKDTKVVISEKKILNPPKALPNLENVLSDFHTELHESKIAMGNESSRSTPSDHESFIEQTAAAMTETELSDWARDSTVSDDFEDVEYELNPDLINVRKNKPPKGIRSLKNSVIKAYIDEFDDLGHVCQKSENLNNILSSIEFMDTGEETSSDEKLLLDACTKNNGYVEFHNEDDIAEDSLNPMFNIVETVNPAIRQALDLENLSSYDNNTGYCFIGNEDNFGSEVISLKPSDLQKLKEKQSAFENEEDSLLVVDTGTTTEENTCSDSTVKNFVEVCAKKETPHMIEALLEEKRVEDENQNNDVEKHQDLVNAEYQEHCQRLQGKFEFGNMRDSIEIRKSKRKEKPVSSKPDLIQEEVSQVNNVELIPPKTLQEIYTKEEIKKSRDENQRLVQEMVMNKMKAQNKSLERKKRSRNSFSPGSSPNKFFELTKSPTADVFLNMEHQQVENERLPPDVLLSSNGSVINCHSEQQQIIEEPQKISPIVTLPDLQQKIVNGEKSELRKSKTRLKSSDELISKIGKENRSIDVQDSIEALVINTERRNSLLYATDTLTKKRKNSFKRSKSGEEPLTHNILNTSEPTRLALSLCSPENPMRSTKSVSEILKTFETADLRRDLSCVDKKAQFYKSDPNLLANAGKEKKTKCKDRDRRKSITKLISEFFGKKREGAKGTNSSASKGFLAKISPKSKSKDKIPAVNLPRRNSFGEAQIRQREAVSPPPIPPLPTNYTGSAPSRYTDESSEGDNDYKHHDQNSCDTLNHSGTHGGRRTSRSMRRASRQSQLKRHRMAQEIQRKLEETEVKTRELEQKGVCVEKALRGEDSGIGAFNTLDEADLLKQWFDLMRDLTELRRYERELMVRAQEVELEDRHARLQQELRERLDNDEHKSKEDIKIESGIINEMMEIVSKRDSLIALLEQDRLRYSEEDRDFEEQMLAKGLRLTPLQKQPVTEVIDKIC
ncbi:F-actin-monooxygenase Mical-like isoform X2 [Photinus pyralis]|uniref:F-actin-monooxygenase Mical-like isoform X2 n=1 Tax=Photinus pyralis TaxID=7054 RepID=UPI001266F9F2|nr:F-actin-monooxygenase Mical-like isoform X2 [Photinus pyralis]